MPTTFSMFEFQRMEMLFYLYAPRPHRSFLRPERADVRSDQGARLVQPFIGTDALQIRMVA